ncbi:AzlD domain-containing protein [Roseomonas terrae]|uniref:AzlD domain-containing protein n=1 Tax=Neoroseomonas terrae TaxID=424799 RepID=A0ABS5EBK8_9PROT|nr:AzlD domain-containing protein [Neoroseomonas terrae]MBR0648401.1 AzlD domain-containing protein [Neoroseomonas terrae]
MTLRLDVLLAILGMALATYLCRAGGYALFRALRPPRFVEVTLQHLPGPIFVAYVAPALAAAGPKGFLAAALVVATQAITRNLAAAIAVGVAAIWLFGLVM